MLSSMKIRTIRVASTYYFFTLPVSDYVGKQCYGSRQQFICRRLDKLGPDFFIVFLLLIITGITLIIFNSIAVRRKHSSKTMFLILLWMQLKAWILKEPRVFVSNTNFRSLQFSKAGLNAFRTMSLYRSN